MEAVQVGHGERYVMRDESGTSVIIDPSPDGHERFAATVESLRLMGVDPDSIEEESLSRAILAPASDEPDLVIILGPPDLIPESMVWELAYSELVFLDLGWDDLTASDLELAIDDFTRRHRRFGGLDS
jgi:undecaprenyl diphosphate synthase